MKRFRTPLTAIGAAVVALATTVVVTQSGVSAAQPAIQADQAVAHLHAQVDLPNGVWTDTPLTVALPFSGTYELDADVRGRLSGVPSVNAYITARLWNATTNTPVPESERLINQIIDHNVGDALTGSNQTAPISEVIRVNGPTTIRLQARRVDAAGAATVAQIYSDGAGYTSLRFDRVAP
ncbi:hypothetical protein FHS29_000884 [Saccharothrix tamanrassetensis]|uniref:Uncharacterized protein n=1 Tax=Saccharothrix tamanrassetensis TaxID=1051531 RepID=A0A841CD74_9PSEU|nr:hypothetical protein [Saccharothrix tamanrassetensis]MBB5954314.1 hypothetical protein [Saccharothrix tamanrassetensis]